MTQISFLPFKMYSEGILDCGRALEKIHETNWTFSSWSKIVSSGISPFFEPEKTVLRQTPGS